MASNFDDVGAFHEKFDLPRVHDRWYVGPRPWDPDLIAFRRKFMQEELEEFDEGVDTDIDHAKMADALIDLVYVAMGTAHLLGYPWEELWDEVQRANMSKQRAAKDGSDSKRGSSWDVVKPPGWTPPDIDGIMRKYRFIH